MIYGMNGMKYKLRNLAGKKITTSMLQWKKRKDLCRIIW
jgi:hypothetical protein